MVLHAIWVNTRNQFHIWGETTSPQKNRSSYREGNNGQKVVSRKKTTKNHQHNSHQETHPYAIPIENLRLVVEQILPDQPIGLLEPGSLLAHLPTINNAPEPSPELLLYGNGSSVSNPRPHPHFRTESGEEDEEIGVKEKKTPTEGGINASEQDVDSKKPASGPRRKTPKGKKIRPSSDTNTSSAETIQQGNWVLPTIALPSNFLLQDLVHLITQKQDFLSHDLICGESLQVWMEVSKIALECIVGQNFLPMLVSEDNSKPGSLASRWQAFLSPEVNEKISKLAQNMPLAGLCSGPAGDSQEPASYLHVVDFINNIIDGFVRNCSSDLEREPQLSGKNRRKKEDPSAKMWFQNLFTTDPYFNLDEQEKSGLLQRLNQWFDPVKQTGSGNGFRTCFKLIPPEGTSENNPDWSLNYNLQAKSDPSLLVPASTVWKERSRVLTFLKHQFENPQERLLEDLGRSARLFPPIEKSLELAHPAEAHFSTRQAYSFLREVSPLLQQAGLGIIVPTWWQKPQSHLGVSITVRKKSGGNTGTGILGFRSIVEYDWQIAVGGEPLSQKEFESLVNLKTPLVQVRGQWVELHPPEIEKAIEFLKQMRRQKQSGDAGGTGQETSLIEVIQMGLGQKTSELGLPITQINAEGELQAIFETLLGGMSKITPLDPTTSFNGILRPYQITGVAWLRFLTQYGFGACLADDMGLGKTIEVIAYLLHEQDSLRNKIPEKNQRRIHRKSSSNGSQTGREGKNARSRATQERRGNQQELGASNPSLIICPMSVVGNWRKEIAKFAPSIKTFVHHGNDRPSGSVFYESVKDFDVVITTYALALRDRALLEKVPWRHLILDEAQNIKNFYAKQSQAIRTFECGGKIALTGTPVENNLMELWSILDFLNPGYLGGHDAFSKQFVVPIQKRQDSVQKELLQKIVQPFILRRLKTDKKIIKDLPEKMEFDVYCNLTQEQASLYEAIVQDMLGQINRADGIQRKGLVLASLMKLKQVCNHPALFLHDRSQIEKRSGKLMRLEEMVEEILEVREKVLIFTQFSEMGQMLKDHLQRILQVEVLFLYGQTSQKQRDLMIERFQQGARGAPIFIISLKAGGLGLNLTAANHVIHFDRWWNPAVENQATDRAYRIGQTKNVQVHKFICSGTVEDKIAEMIEVKKELADQIVKQGESWVTELSTAQLKEIFALTREAMISS